MSGSEAAWRRRYRAPRSGFPAWAQERADRLLYLSNHVGRFEVFAWDRQRGVHRQVTDRPEGTGYRVASRLDPPGDHVWWWNDSKGDEFGTWTLERFAGGDRRDAAALAPSYSAGLALGRSVAVIGRSTGEEGSTVYVVPHGDRPIEIYRHRESARVGRLSADQTLFSLEHSEHGDSRNPAVRILDLTGARAGELWDGPDRGLRAGAWSPLPGDQRLLLLHERADALRPLVFDARTGQAREVQVDLPGEIVAEWYPDAGSLLLAQRHRGRVVLHRYFVGSGELQALATQPGWIDDARVRPDGEVWYQWSGSAEPSHTRSASAVVLRPPGPQAPAGVAYRDIDVRGIHGFLAEPSSGRRPRPTLFLVHGGPESLDADSWSPGVQAWVDHGFAVVMVNYRGSTGYGKAWKDAIKGRPGLTELEDIAAVQDALVAGGVADRGRCVIGGGSWGGYLTLLGLGTQPERWAAGLAVVPIGDYVAAFEDEMEPLKRYDAALFGGTPAQVPEVYRQSDPITYADRVIAPVLLVVGQNDPRCPSRSADLYERRLQQLGKPHQTYRYDAGHGSLVVDEQIRQTELQLSFLARHLSTPVPLA